MDDSFTMCFCTSSSQGKIKEHIRERMKPTDALTKDILRDVHASIAGDDFAMGRCGGCIDEIEDLIVDYQKGVWS